MAHIKKMCAFIIELMDNLRGPEKFPAGQLLSDGIKFFVYKLE